MVTLVIRIPVPSGDTNQYSSAKIAVPYRCLVGKYLRPGVNTLEVEVTNLPANRIADMDRRDVPWRIYKDANIVNIHYKKDNYGKWEPVPSGLLGPVHLIPMQTLK